MGNYSWHLRNPAITAKEGYKDRNTVFLSFSFFPIRIGEFNFLTPFLIVSINILIRNGKAIITQKTQLEEASSKSPEYRALAAENQEETGAAKTA